MLLQEAQRCDQALLNSYRSSSDNDSDHVIKVFTKLMLQGNIRAAVRWITERSGGGLLYPTESVVEALKSKHPDSHIPSDYSIPCCDNLPFCEDSEITVAQVQFIASCLQSGAGPGGCQLLHWRDALLRYGSSSGCLCEAMAVLCRLLCNSIVLVIATIYYNTG